MFNLNLVAMKSIKVVKTILDFEEIPNNDVNNVLLLEFKQNEIDRMPKHEKFELYRDISNEIWDMRSK